MSCSFDAERGLVVASTRVWGPNGDVLVRLALDTGATSTLVNWDLLVLLGYDPAGMAERVQVTTGSGVEFAPRVMVDRLQALGEERHGFLVVAHTLPPSASIDGLLGLDFFRERRLTIDFREATISID